MKIAWLLAMVLVIGVQAWGQRAVQFERTGTLKTLKFFEGERMVYKIKNDTRHWLEEYIEEIHVDEGLIQFENRAVFVDSIYAVRVGNASGFVRGMSAGLVTFSYAWGFWTLVSLAYGDPLAVSTVIIGAGSYLVGKLMKLTFFRTHKLNRRKRLKLIDLTFYDQG
ncbi:MAG: hypothetical protein OEQ53_08515 [Saprospiraceae bacterium]|nr:hypothetical protein [Saprospiraceae bacterium]